MSRGECPVEVESTFCALHRLAVKREEYTGRDQAEAFDGLILGQIDTTWLGDLFRTARNKLDALPISSGSKTEIVAAESLPEGS